MSTSRYYFAVFSFVGIVAAASGVLGLRLVSLDVPSAVMKGESVMLNCSLDLESDDLYSVKWYKNDVEFYRYLPRDKPAGQKYELPGVHVQLEKSIKGRVFLHNTDLDTEGIYRCEASAESPTFQTVEGEKEIKVYVLPQEGPTIHGSQPRYDVGDTVNVSCKSGPSKPAAALKWYINAKEAHQDFEVPYPTIDHPNGLQTSSLGLTFTVTPPLLNGGAINLKCIAIVSQAYSMTSEELIIGAEEVASPSASTRDGPMITGGQVHYRVGDLLDVNCSSSRSKPAPELQWFLNDKQVENENIIRYPNTKYPDGQESASLGLHFKVGHNHFDENDEMRLKCTATLSKVINMRSDEKTVGGNHRSSGFHVAENAGKVTNTSGCGSSQLHVFCTFLFLFTMLPAL